MLLEPNVYITRRRSSGEKKRGKNRVRTGRVYRFVALTESLVLAAWRVGTKRQLKTVVPRQFPAKRRRLCVSEEGARYNGVVRSDPSANPSDFLKMISAFVLQRMMLLLLIILNLVSC